MPHIMINNCNMYYEEHGTGQHTVVFLHGLFFNRAQFHQQMVALRDRYRCVMVDLRGQGLSSAPADGFELDSIARDLTQFIDVKRYGPCHLVGHAMGGIVALHMAIMRPQLVNSLTLISASAGEPPFVMKRRLRAHALKIKLFGMRFVLPLLTKQLFSPTHLANPAHKDQINHWRQELLKMNRQNFARAIAGLLARKPLYDELYTIRKPALIIAGELDTVTSREVTNRLNNGIVGAQLLLVPDAGHAVNLEKPAVVNNAVTQFLTRHTGKQQSA